LSLALPSNNLLSAIAVFALGTGYFPLLAQELQLPPRPETAPTGSQFVKQITSLPLAQREQQIIAQVSLGNVPKFLRSLQPVQVTNSLNGITNAATFYVTPDYLAIGSDEDYFLAPISPETGQILADQLKCLLPTRKMVDDIYAAAPLKLIPAPIPPSPAMTSVEVFNQHNSIVRTQRLEQLKLYPLGTLVAGHQKDVVVSSRLTNAPGKVAIYGWHQTNGNPIQPLYLGHASSWVDYSQCTRLVLQDIIVNGKPNTLSAALADPSLAPLFSDEGPIPNPRYLDKKPLSPTIHSLADFEKAPFFNERTASFTIDHGVKIHINAPAQEALASKQKTRLIFYALPNGNTTAQTIGKSSDPTEDWHFNIQHIGAQTRFLRELMPDTAVIIVYLENELLSWPSWRKQFGDKSIPQIISGVQKIISRPETEIVLSGHSGGGSFIFGYLNSLNSIPNEIVRIAFLDSNYAYDPSLGHKYKLVNWLSATSSHFLSVLAYDDASALLDGKSFVSARGGTWGRSHAMLNDLGEMFPFVTKTNSQLETHTALDGRIQFLLKPNPERKIYHSIQVELNGFIQAMLSGTPLEGKNYEYFGPRSYSKWIPPAETPSSNSFPANSPASLKSDSAPQ